MKIEQACADDANNVAQVVSASNKDVAEKFGINFENNPKHPSFYNEEWVLSDMQRGEEYFLCKEDNELIGCVAFEKSRSGTGYLNRLSVLPRYRKRGVGAKLVSHVFEVAKTREIEKISIGIIADHVELKKWYLKLGFNENGLKEFPHLPFDVLFMRYDVLCE